MEFTLLFAAGTALAATWVANRLTRPGVDKPTDLLIGSAAVGLFVGRIAAMALDGVNPLTNLADILIVRAGVDTGFATVGALTALAWGTRAGLPRVSDLLAPAALAGLAGWHGGCVWRSTCLGTATPSPFATGYKLQPWLGAVQQTEQTVTPRTTTTAIDATVTSGEAYTYKLFAYFNTWTSTQISNTVTVPSC